MSSPTRYDIERAVGASDLPPVERHIVLALCTYMDQGSTLIPAQYTPSLTRLAEVTGWNRRTIRRHIKALAKAGWLGLARVPGKRYRYAVTCPQPDPARDTEPSELGTGSPAARDTEPPVQTSSERDPEIALVIEEIRKRTGKTISGDLAIAARDFILARPRRHDDALSRARYLRQTIAGDRDPARFLPTPTPPKFTKERGFA